jgi:putative ABC transport system permease protein
MLTLRNAFTSIARSKGRNLLIGLIVTVIAGAACVALAIRNSADAAASAALSGVTIQGSIGRDTQKIMASLTPAGSTDRPDMTAMRDLMEQYPDLTLDQLQGYAASDHVADFLYSASLTLDTTGEVEPYSSESTETSNEEGDDQGESSGPGGFGGPMRTQGTIGIQGGTMGDLTVVAYSAENAMTGFLNGTQKISAGSMIDLTQADNNCLVSGQFALYNGLSAGDELILANPNATDETYTCQVVGLYDTADTTSGQNLPGGITALSPANQVLVSYPTLTAWAESSASVATTTTNDWGQEQSTALTPQTSASYLFLDPTAYEAFDAELRASGLSDYYTLTSPDLTAYESATTPLENLSGFATTLLWIILGVGAVVLVAISFFNVRERKYEVGVYTAIGLPKPQVALQFATEVLAVTLAGVVLGLGLGAVAAVPVADNLLSSQVAQAEAEADTQNQNFGRTGGAFPDGGGFSGVGRLTNLPGGVLGRNTGVDYIDQIDATVNLAVAGQLGAIGLGLAVLASLTGVVLVMRYEPLTILANRA